MAPRVAGILCLAWLAFAPSAAAEAHRYDCRFSGDFTMVLQLSLDRDAQSAMATRTDGRVFAAYRMYPAPQDGAVLHIEFGDRGQDFLLMIRPGDGRAEYVADDGMAWVAGVCRRL